VTRRRRAALLLGLAVVLGALAASDVSRREAALRDQLGPAVGVVVAAGDLRAGRRLRANDLEVRRIPQRFAPAGGPALPELLLGRRLAVPVPRGAQLAEHHLERDSAPGPAIRRGERAVDVVAAGSPELILPGAHVDVLVAREPEGASEVAVEDVEVLAVRSAQDGGVAVTLRVSAREAVYLAATGAFTREVRLLARAPGDRGRLG
jgi:pilus assembly protein CpaB